MPNKFIASLYSEQVQELLSQMTLEQKIGQMTQADRMTCTPAEVKHFHLGSVLSAAGSCPENNQPADWVRMNDEFWRASIEQTEEHLPIPILYGLDAIHGNNNVRGATIFPHNIGLGATRDLNLLRQVVDVSKKEILATGVDWVFAPNLGVARDYHWGRCYESFSEDPKLVSDYADVIVTEYHKNLETDGIVTCIKHWVGDGGTRYGLDQGDTNLSEEDLERLHIKPYHSALNAGAMTVMASFSSWNGDKCHAHHYLITQVLKQRMGFEGFVISDMQGIDYLADDFYQAVEKGVNAGIDMFMVPDNWKLFIEHLQSHVDMGTISVERIDNAVSRILSVKFACGLFEKKCPAERRHTSSSTFGSAENRDVARNAVRKSLVLLKNDTNLLPLKREARVFVAGKNANNIGHQCGGFTLSWQGVSGNDPIEGGSSIWEGIHQYCPDAQLSETEHGTEVDPAIHDVAIVVIGERPYAEGQGDVRDGVASINESGSLVQGQVNIVEAAGSSLELCHLHPEDIETIRNISNKGIPVVTILVSGRPLVINPELALSDAFVAAWLPGSEGKGVAEVLFGDYDFAGSLSFSWPKHTHPTVNIGDQPYEPLFPYGYGLRYLDSERYKPKRKA